MSKALIAAVAAAAMLAGATPLSDASAMMLVAPPAFGIAGASSRLLHVTVICGRGGCAPVRVSRVYHPPRGFVKKAAPLVFPRPSPPPSAPANN